MQCRQARVNTRHHLPVIGWRLAGNAFIGRNPFSGAYIGPNRKVVSHAKTAKILWLVLGFSTLRVFRSRFEINDLGSKKELKCTYSMQVKTPLRPDWRLPPYSTGRLNFTYLKVIASISTG